MSWCCKCSLVLSWAHSEPSTGPPAPLWTDQFGLVNQHEWPSLIISWCEFYCLSYLSLSHVFAAIITTNLFGQDLIEYLHAIFRLCIIAHSCCPCSQVTEKGLTYQRIGFKIILSGWTDTFYASMVAFWDAVCSQGKQPEAEPLIQSTVTWKQLH